MSFKDMLSKILGPYIDPQTKESVENLYDLMHPPPTVTVTGDNGVEETYEIQGPPPPKQNPPSPPEEPKKASFNLRPKKKRRHGPAPRERIPTRVSTKPIRDWLCITEAAREAACHRGDVLRLIEAGHIDSVTWTKKLPCVNVHQLCVWLERKEKTPIALEPTLEWDTMSAISKLLDVNSGTLHERAESGELAAHRAGKGCRLMNIAECAEMFGTDL